MKLSRRRFLHLASDAATFAVVPRFACAARPVRLIVGFPPGGPSDISARIIAQWLSQQPDQQVFVENRSGAGGNIGTEDVAHAPPDGHTILLVTTSNAISATLYKRPDFNFVRDIAPVAGISRYPFVMLVNPRVPARTVPELIASAKANPGKLNMGSAGIGTPFHVAGELFKMMTGVNMVHVPYRGSALMLRGLLDGEVQVAFDSVQASVGYIRAGALLALAVTTGSRVGALPDVRTMESFVPGYRASGWNGIGVPIHTPAEIIDRLNQQINTGLTDVNVRTRFADLGATVLVDTPAAFRELISNEIEKWARVIKFAGIRAL